MNSHARVGLVVFLAGLSGCVPKPEKAYTPEEVAQISSVAELMRVHAEQADPLFGKREQASFSDDEYGQMAKAGAIIDATSKRLQGFVGTGEFDEGFGKFAQELNTHANALRTAAAAKDAKAASEALTSMKATCSGCHGVYR